MHKCTECESKGTLEDIVYNSECSTCNSCWCTSCNFFGYGTEETFCPEGGNPCYGCGHIKPPDSCAVWPGEGDIGRTTLYEYSLKHMSHTVFKMRKDKLKIL